jgi:hypothetical protein
MHSNKSTGWRYLIREVVALIQRQEKTGGTGFSGQVGISGLHEAKARKKPIENVQLFLCVLRDLVENDFFYE